MQTCKRVLAGFYLLNIAVHSLAPSFAWGSFLPSAANYVWDILDTSKSASAFLEKLKSDLSQPQIDFLQQKLGSSAKAKIWASRIGHQKFIIKSEGLMVPIELQGDLAFRINSKPLNFRANWPVEKTFDEIMRLLPEKKSGSAIYGLVIPEANAVSAPAVVIGVVLAGVVYIVHGRMGSAACDMLTRVHRDCESDTYIELNTLALTLEGLNSPEKLKVFNLGVAGCSIDKKVKACVARRFNSADEGTKRRIWALDQRILSYFSISQSSTTDSHQSGGGAR